MLANEHFRWRGPVTALAIFLVTSVFLTACQTTDSLDDADKSDSSTAASRVSKDFYSPFFDRGDHLQELVKNGNFDDAATLFDEQSAYFTNPKNRKENSATLSRIATHFNDPIAGAVNQNLIALRAVRWPLPAKEWAKTKSSIAASRDATSGYPDLAILRDPDFRLGAVDSLSNETLRVTNLLKANANAAIAGFDHFAALCSKYT